jgi:hypothetical protein
MECSLNKFDGADSENVVKKFKTKTHVRRINIYRSFSKSHLCERIRNVFLLLNKKSMQLVGVFNSTAFLSWLKFDVGIKIKIFSLRYYVSLSMALFVRYRELRKVCNLRGTGDTLIAYSGLWRKFQA